MSEAEVVRATRDLARSSRSRDRRSEPAGLDVATAAAASAVAQRDAARERFNSSAQALGRADRK